MRCSNCERQLRRYAWYFPDFDFSRNFCKACAWAYMTLYVPKFSGLSAWQMPLSLSLYARVRDARQLSLLSES